MRKETYLYELPNSEFEFGGEIDDLARAAGYSSGKAWANEANAWEMSVDEAREELSFAKN